MSETEQPRDLLEQAKKMTDFATNLKNTVSELKDIDLSMMIEENKLCTSMFKQVFAILVTEQVNRNPDV